MDTAERARRSLSPKDNGASCNFSTESEEQMKIELSRQARTDAVASIQRYFLENMPEELGTLPADLLLNFFMEEIGPLLYNRAVADAQARMQLRVADLSGELYVDELQYWPRHDAKRKSKR
jgi:uncharacterized protein (DUF2164 family)